MNEIYTKKKKKEKRKKEEEIKDKKEWYPK